MADDIVLNSGAGGSTCAADDCAGIFYQKMKLVDGTADSTTPIPGDANGLKVQLGAALPAGTAAIGKLAANSGVDIGDVDVTSIAAGDNNIGNVDIVTVPAPLSTTGAGTVATALRTTLGSDDPAVAALQIIDNCIAGSEAQVDVITVPAPLSVVGTGTEAAAMRVTIATDSTGVLSVDDNGSALTVDNGGTFAVQATLAAETTKVIGTVNIAASQTVGLVAGAQNIGDVDILTIAAGDNNIGNVDVVSVPAPLSTTGAGTVATALRATLGSDDPAVTALQIMDDWDSAASDSCSVSGDVAHDAADAGEPVKVGFKNKLFDGTAPGATVSAEDDRVNAIADGYGRQYVETTHPNYWNVSADYASAQTNATVKAAPGVNLSLFITDIVISNGAVAGNITLLDGSGGTVKLEIYPPINGGVAIALRTPIKLTANTLLAITSTTVTTHSVNICGYTAAVTG